MVHLNYSNHILSVYISCTTEDYKIHYMETSIRIILYYLCTFGVNGIISNDIICLDN